MSEPPDAVVELARRRSEARAARDFTAADALRDQIGALGWVVADGPEGFTLTPRPPFEVLPSLATLPDRSGQADSRRCSVGLLVEGWLIGLFWGAFFFMRKELRYRFTLEHEGLPAPDAWDE